MPAERALRTGVRAEKLMALDAVLAEARAAKSAGASRFCMGAAWREPKDRDLDQVCAMVEGVKALGLETCATLGMLTRRAGAAAQAGGPRLLQPQPRHLARILRGDHHHAHLPGSPGDARARARRRHPRLLRRHRRHGRDARGPRRHDRDAGGPAAHPESVPINMLVRVAGTPLAGEPRSTRSNSCAPSRSPASPCRARWCGSRPAART